MDTNPETTEPQIPSETPDEVEQEPSDTDSETDSDSKPIKSFKTVPLADLVKERNYRKELQETIKANEVVSNDQRLRIEQLETELFEMKSNVLLSKYQFSDDDLAAIQTLPTLEQREQWAERLKSNRASQDSKPWWNLGQVEPMKKNISGDDGIPKMKSSATKRIK